MSSKDKAVERIKSRPTDYTWDELTSLLRYFDFEANCRSGSHVKYIGRRDKVVINLAKPHPGNIVKRYLIDQVLIILKERGDIDG